jgi:hypothetical protein
MKPLQVHPNQRYLQHSDGSSFFYLGDTAWELFHRCDRDEADFYLRTRAEQGFTVIQAVILAELDGLRVPNPRGHVPFHDLDPLKPNEGYFEDVDWIIEKATSYGLRMGILPTWGDKYQMNQWGKGPEVLTPENAEPYAKFLGDRYAWAEPIWILGGDRPIDSDKDRAVNEKMAAGIRSSRAKHQLVTLHPCGQCHSSQYFHNADWLDFNMAQTGHSTDRDNYNSVAKDYALTPVKPCMDAEPGYEDHPSKFNPENGYMMDDQTRKFAYWALFAGAHGHTYGCHDIWQMWLPGRDPITAARTPWTEAIHLPGAVQMGHVRNLMESTPNWERVPAQDLIRSSNPDGPDHVRATKGEKGDFALVYSATGQAFDLDFSQLDSGVDRARWFDPRSGSYKDAEPPVAAAKPPSAGPGQDWVLVLDKT